MWPLLQIEAKLTLTTEDLPSPSAAFPLARTTVVRGRGWHHTPHAERNGRDVDALLMGSHFHAAVPGSTIGFSPLTVHRHTLTLRVSMYICRRRSSRRRALLRAPSSRPLARSPRPNCTHTHHLNRGTHYGSILNRLHWRWHCWTSRAATPHGSLSRSLSAPFSSLTPPWRLARSCTPPHARVRGTRRAALTPRRCARR